MLIQFKAIIVLGIVAMDDGVALLLFALASSIAGVLLGQSTMPLGMSMLHLAWEIGLSIFLGFLFGYVLSRIIRSYKDEDKILAFSLGSILLLIGLATALEADLILAAMSMGFFKTNFTPRSSQSTFKLVERFSPPIYILFFVLVGAKMDFSALTPFVIIMAFIYLLGRTGGKFAGAKLGARISKAPDTVRKYLPFCLLSQAGVAIGLSIMAGQNFPGETGNTIILIVTTTTFIVQLIGPSAVKFAVTKAGEVGLNITEEDLMKTCTMADIISAEPISVLDQMPASKVLDIFSRNDNLFFPVLTAESGGKTLAGVITIDSLRETMAEPDMANWLLAHDLMEDVICTCTPDMSLIDVKEIMARNHVDYIPVIDKEGDFRGIMEERLIHKHISARIISMKQKAERLG